MLLFSLVSWWRWIFVSTLSWSFLLWYEIVCDVYMGSFSSGESERNPTGHRLCDSLIFVNDCFNISHTYSNNFWYFSNSNKAIIFNNLEWFWTAVRPFLNVSFTISTICIILNFERVLSTNLVNCFKVLISQSQKHIQFVSKKLKGRSIMALYVHKYM